MEIIEQTPDRIVVQEIASYRVFWQALTTCTLDKPTDLLVIEEQRGNTTRRAQFPLHDVVGANVESSEVQEATDVPSYRCILYLRGPDSVALGRWAKEGRGLVWLAASIRLFLDIGRFPPRPEGVSDPNIQVVEDKLAAIRGEMETLSRIWQTLPGNNPLTTFLKNAAHKILQGQSESPEIIALREQVRAHPEDVEGHLQLAYLLRLKKQPQPAQESLEQAIRLVQAQGNRGRAEQLTGILYHWIME